MKKILLLSTALLFVFFAKGQTTYEYHAQPFPTHIYTLENGLKVYLTENKAEPRVQTYVCVRAGSKYDPSYATGLAHYLEHIMFKGNSKIGALNWKKEEPLLLEIEALFNQYGKTIKEEERKKIYAQIDSLSAIAAQYVVPQEYDRLVGEMGAKGTNAFTWIDQTVYVNDIPSNAIERWLKLEAVRFGEMAPRLFHTELEAVYEEKNRSLDNDGSKVWEGMFHELFKGHPYGDQTTIGTIENLKNPSITEIKNFFDKWYVPNNMAICMSGDLNHEEVIKKIEKYWGKKKAKSLDEPMFAPLNTRDKAIEKTVTGPDAESVNIAFSFPGYGHQDALMMELLMEVLYNGQAGLIDLNINAEQKALGAYAGGFRMRDYSMLYLSAQAREGQSLEEVKELLLAQIDSIKAGSIDDNLLEAIMLNRIKSTAQENLTNRGRARNFIRAFIWGADWKEYASEEDQLSKVSKKDLAAFAKRCLTNDHVVIYKRKGDKGTIQKVEKPAITPLDLEANREKSSKFAKKLAKVKMATIAPQFLDFEKDLEQFNWKKGERLLYKKNTDNTIFKLYYVVEVGSYNDPTLALAIQYLDYLGTSTLSNKELLQKFYSLGASYSVSASQEQVYVMVEGLAQNFEETLRLFESLLNDAQANEKALDKLIGGILAERANAKLDKGTILKGAMLNYAKYGTASPYFHQLSEKELKALTSKVLLSKIDYLNTLEHSILYYGPTTADEVKAKLQKYHDAKEVLKPCPKIAPKTAIIPSTRQLYFIDYDMVQAEVLFVSPSIPYSADILSEATLFRAYFGGGLSSIVFQYLREAQALAYSVRSNYEYGTRLGEHNYVVSYIGTQSDKLDEAMKGMQALLDTMPYAERNFQSAKQNVLESMRTQRIVREGVLFEYIRLERKGINDDPRATIYTGVQALEFNDINTFHANYIANQPQTIIVIGDIDKVNMENLKQWGELHVLTLEQVFGY